MYHDTATALAVLSLGTISISLAVYSSSSSNAANMSGGGGGGASIVFAKGMLVGSASTLAVLASSAYVAFKRIFSEEKTNSNTKRHSTTEPPISQKVSHQPVTQNS